MKFADTNWCKYSTQEYWSEGFLLSWGWIGTATEWPGDDPVGQVMLDGCWPPWCLVLPSPSPDMLACFVATPNRPNSRTDFHLLFTYFLKISRSVKHSLGPISQKRSVKVALCCCAFTYIYYPSKELFGACYRKLFFEVSSQRMAASSFLGKCIWKRGWKQTVGDQHEQISLVQYARVSDLSMQLLACYLRNLTLMGTTH